MKTFKEFLGESVFKKGQKVKVKNAKKYDSLAKPEVSGEVLGMMNKSTVMIKTNSGQMNVDISDIVSERTLNESSELTFKAVSSADKNGMKFLIYTLPDGRETYPVGFYKDLVKDEKSFVRDLRKILEK